MRVVASSIGYFGSVREAGDEFDVPEGTTGSWFAPATTAEAESKPAGKGKRKSAEPEPAGDEAADAI